MGTMINRRRAYGGKKGLLPSGYKQLEYIENTSNAYIETSITAAYLYDDGEFDVTFSTANANKNNRFIGCAHSTHKNAVDLCCAVYQSHSSYKYGNTWNNILTPTILSDTITNYKYSFTSSQQSLYINNTLVGTTNYPWNSATNNYKFGLFSIDTYPSPSRIENTKVYKCVVKHQGNIILNLFPCKDSNNIVGMYDTVNGVFYSSPNGTAFIAGPEI